MRHVTSAELLAVGTELLLGETIDTNSGQLASSLAQQGVDVYWSQRAGDNLERVREAIRQALERSDLLVITGGLGPTDDDTTREAIAAAVGEEPAVDPELEAVLRERFERLSRRMPVGNMKQAWTIPSAQALPNPLGTAPGWLVRTNVAGAQRFIVALPGPPRECERMWLQEALPRLPLPPATLQRITIKTHGVGESRVAELLTDLTGKSNPTVATYARSDGVHVRVAAKAGDVEAARSTALMVANEVRRRLGEAVWGVDDEELPQLVVAALQRRGLTLAVFEEPSSGHLLEAVSSVTGGQDACRGGVVAWAPQTMAALGLPVPVALGASSPEYAVRLAEAIRHTLAADVGVAVTSGGTPDAGRQEQATVEAVVAVHAGGEPAVKHLAVPSLPAAWWRERLSYFALHLLWSQLR